MRKWIAMVMACLLVLGQVALAEIPDVSTLTDEELVQLAQDIQEEQDKRA